jgi:cytochrome P450
MPLLTGVASETLRMYPAAVSISRRAAQVRGTHPQAPPRAAPRRSAATVWQSGAASLTPALLRGAFPPPPPPPARPPQDTVLGGYFLPAGTRVGASVYGLQRHEDFWPQPDA